MRAHVPSILTACITASLVASHLPAFTLEQQPWRVRPITWEHTAPVRARLEAQGITATSFPSYVARTRQANARRVREGDIDHLVFYLLQSNRFTPLPRIEPALSARALVASLGPAEREAFLRGSDTDLSRIPSAVVARAAELLRAFDSSIRDARLEYFRDLVKATFPDQRTREAAILREYLRVMRFVYEKEFIAQRSERASEAVAELYRRRGLSTDTAVEAGFLVHYGLGIVRSLDADRRIRRVLIIGPGLDLAPRTGLLDAGSPESYQPWAVMDALLAHGLSTADDLEVVGVDINPRVVEHLRRARRRPPMLTLVTGIREDERVTFSEAYRDYFAQLGRAIGEVGAGADSRDAAGHRRKTVKVARAAANALRAQQLDIVTERFDHPPTFDLVVATNILPYFDDVELTLALSNVAAMMAPGGVFLHNEARPVLGEITATLGLRFEQSRHVVIATVSGAPAPLFDSVWLHTRR